MENDWKKRLGIVYSTDPGFDYDTGKEEEGETPEPGAQLLTIRLDRKNRKGKTVTLVEGFSGREEDLKALGRELRNRCGAGGSAGDGTILIQGDFRDRTAAFLEQKGYRIKRSGGSR